MSTTTNATKKIITDLQAVLFAADTKLDQLAERTPALKDFCTDILTAYSNVPVTAADTEKLAVALKSVLVSNFNVDINKF